MLIDISPSVTSIGFWGVTGSKKVIDISRAKISIDINWPILILGAPFFGLWSDIEATQAGAAWL